MSKEQTALEAMLAQYEEAAASSSDSTFDKANYFTTYLEDGVNSKMKKIRILPNENGTPFEEVKVHSAKVDGKNRKFTCIKHLDDKPCPFCDARAELLATGDKDDEETAKSYNARVMYIVKVIDRELEDDGPKFWRFPINYKKEGIHDKIMAVVRMLKADITSTETGRDLVLNIERVKNPRGGTYPAVNSIQGLDKSVLSDNAELAEKWLANEKVWKDVYSVKDYEYLKIIVEGGIPAFDKKLKKFVPKSELEAREENVNDGIDAEVSMGADSKEPVVETADVAEATYVADVDKQEDNGDDLPF
jgi:hypothetical protein